MRQFLMVKIFWFWVMGFFLLSQTGFCMPPHPSLRGLNGISRENSKFRHGGIRSKGGIIPSGIRRSISSVGTQVNRILVLRTPFTEGVFPQHDSFSVGAGLDAYATVKAKVEQYYLEQSRSRHRVELSFPAISTAIKFSQSHSFYGAQTDPRILEDGVLEILALWDLVVDFSDFDSVMIMHAGNGQEVRSGQSPTLIHSFRSTFTNPYDSQDGVTVFSYVLVPEFYALGNGDQLDAVLGVIVHEYGHELGLPDLYDASTSNFNQGIGDWGVMGGGSFGGPNQDGTVPVGFSAWSKLFLGWLEPVDGEDGSKFLLPSALGGTVLRIPAQGPGNPQEYFLLENRYNGSLTGGVKNWDQYLPLDNSTDSTGILILHMDESRAFLDSGFGDGSNRWDGNRIQMDASRKFLDVVEASTSQDLDSSGGISNADDSWSSGSSQAFGPSGNFLAEPYSGNPNGIEVVFLSAPGESMSITLTQNFEMLRVDSSQPGTLLIDFTGIVMDLPANSSLSFSPGIGNLQVSKISSNRMQVLYDGSLSRSQPTALIFSGLQSQSGATPSNVDNFAGTTISRYILEGSNTWTESKSPYLVEDGDLLLESSSSLRLESGTVVLLGSGSAGSFPSSHIDVTILGKLTALGTATKPVKILSTQTGRGNWGTLFFGASQDKPSFLRHVIIAGGGFGSSGPCVEIRDRSEHIFAYVTWTDCNFGVRVGTTYPSQQTGTINGGGGRPKIYNSVFEKLSRGILIDSSHADLHLINNFFQDWDSVAVNFQAADKGSLNHFRFTEFLGGAIASDPPFEFANTATGSAPTLAIGDLNEFYSKRGTTNESLIQINPSASVFATEQNSLSEPVSRDWTVTKLSFLDPSLNQKISSIKDGDSLRLQAEASSVTNFNATTKRLLAASLEADSMGQKILVILEETTANSRTFLSQPISTNLSGHTSSTLLILDSTDTLRASALGSSGLITTIPVNSPPSEPITLSLTPVFTNNRLQLTYDLSVPSGQVVSQVQAEYSTDGGSSWILSTELASLSTSPTQSLTWFAFRELGVGFNGDVSLRLTSLSEISASVSTVSTFSHQIQTQILDMNYALEAGWNLISVFPLPGQTPGAYFSVFESSMTSCAYSYFGGGFYHFCPDSLAASENSTSTALSSSLTQGQSFWIQSSASTSLSVSSGFDPRIPIHLEAGWNLSSLGYSGTATPTHLDKEVRAIFEFQPTPPSGFYAVSYPSTPSTTHSRVQIQITNFSLRKGTWIYSRSKTTISPHSLP
jgi:M6 family metalloprotease-like protein